MIKTVPVKFKASDGMEFESAVEAERHDGLVLAREAYVEACRLLNRRLAETQRTADGQMFDFGLSRDYWYLAPGWQTMPRMYAISFSGWSCSVEVRSDGGVAIISEDETRSRTAYRIVDLYRNKRKAEEALVAAKEEWLAVRSQEVAEYRAEIYSQV